MDDLLGARFGCTVANRFGQLLDDVSDPFDHVYELLAKQEYEENKEELNKQEELPVEGKKESPRERKLCARAGGDADVRRVVAQRCPVRTRAEERVQRCVAFNESWVSEDSNSLGSIIERFWPVEIDKTGRGSGRGRGARGRGYPKSTDGLGPRGKREFERHSGSDRASVRPEEKRGGSGSHNWGSMKDHISAVADAAPNVSAESEEVPDTAQPDEENQAIETLEVAFEMSLDEWKALQEQSRLKTAFNIRKVETEMPSKAMVIHKSKCIEEHAKCATEDVVFQRPVNDITHKLDINFGSLTRQSRRGRGGRGGRGRGTTQKSPDKSFEMAPNPDDPKDFPALA